MSFQHCLPHQQAESPWAWKGWLAWKEHWPEERQEQHLCPLINAQEEKGRLYFVCLPRHAAKGMQVSSD